MARKIVDESNLELISILDALLERDDDITARAVTRLHSSLANASAISRNSTRQELLVKYQKRQKEFRSWHAKSLKTSRASMSAELARMDAVVIKLQGQISTLTLSHKLMIQTVGELGGMPKLLEFYARHQHMREQLEDIGIIGEGCSTPPI